MNVSTLSNEVERIEQERAIEQRERRKPVAGPEPLPNVVDAAMDAMRCGNCAASLIESRDYWLERANGTHWIYRDSDEVKAIFKQAAEALGPSINAAVEARAKHQEIVDFLRDKEHRS